MLKSWIPQDKIDWKSLSYNKNPNTLYLLQSNPDKIDWRNLSKTCPPMLFPCWKVFMKNTIMKYSGDGCLLILSQLTCWKKELNMKKHILPKRN